MAQTPGTGQGARRTLGRREFLTSAGAAMSLTLVSSQAVRAAQANEKIDIGVVGCGGRGGWIADLFKQHGGYNVVAGADYFQDRVDAFGDRFGIDASRRFTGLDCFKRLLDVKLDAVAIESPPYFHPEQAAAAVDAGKHVFLAKPIAVDVPGCRVIAECGKRATGKKLAFLVDFQTRAHPLYQEAVKRVREGALGRIVSGEACYFCGPTFDHLDRVLRAAPEDPEARLRAWGLSRELSGDIITEQNIHAIDMASWVLDADPVKAYGTGGHRRPFLGNCWDHFAVIYHYPQDVVLSMSSKQFGAGWDDILCRVYGLGGTLDAHYSGRVSITGEKPFEGGSADNLYHGGAVANIADFHRCVTQGDFSNPTVAPSVRSNLTTILGRTAAYRGREVTWSDMMRANEKLEADLKGLKS